MRSTKSHFFAVLLFLVASAAMVMNIVPPRISAADKEADVFQAVDPIANVLDEILDNYVQDPKLDEVVEGALKGMMDSLDEHCSFVPAKVYQHLKEDTEGEFGGVGVTIKLDDDKNIEIMQAVENSPAAKAGVVPGDRIVKIDDVSTRGMSLDEAKDRIRGPIGTSVTLGLFRRNEGLEIEPQELSITVKRDSIPLESVTEARLLGGGIGYVRLSDFKNTSADEIAKEVKRLNTDGALKSLILDLRWNPGGLLSASKDVAELFLADNTLVVYTKGRETGQGNITEDLKLYTEKNPVVPQNLPIVVLVNEWTASAAEIITGSFQYWSRALIVGEKTYGKGSVQTIVPLTKPAGSALRLTTALYYTPAGVTIDKRGIIPDVPVPMDKDQQRALYVQMLTSYKDDPSKSDAQNHGSVTGDAVTAETVEDVQLKRAVEILTEDALFDNLLKKYHKDPKDTQIAAISPGPEEAKVAERP